MKKNQLKIVLSVYFIALLAVTGIPFVSAAGTVSEDFTTTTFEDPSTTAVGWGSGSVSNPRSYSITQLDFFSTPDPVSTLNTQGRKVYTGAYYDIGSNGFRVFNISDPTDIALMDTRSVSHVLSVEVDGDICYVGTAQGGGTWLGVYNVSDPLNIPGPIYSSNLEADGHITDFAVQGRFLYVIMHQTSGTDFQIFDVTDPTSPIYTDGAAWSWSLGIDVLGHVAYIADGPAGLYTRNVSNPYGETGLDSVNTPGNATDCLVDGQYCYVADGPSGVQVVDVSNPASLSIVETYDTPSSATRLARQGNTLFVADNTSVQILDISNPLNIAYVDQISLSGVHDVDVTDGGVLVIGTDAGLYTYRVGSMAIDLPLVKSYSAYDALDVAFQGDIAYVAAGSDGLVVLDVRNPANPILLDQYRPASTVDYTSVDVQGGYAYICNWGTPSKGVISFDVSDPTDVKFLDVMSYTYPYDLAVSGDLLSLADGLAGYYLNNISNPAAMVLIDYTGVIDNATAVAVQGHFAYLVGNGSSFGAYGTFAYNLNDPSNILETGFIGHINPEDIVVKGDFAAVANREWGVNFVDMSDPWDINNLGFMAYTGADLTCVEMFGNYIFAGERGVGIHLIDANNPNDLIELANYTTGNPDVRNLAVGGDYLYAACGSSLRIFRIFRSAGDTYQNPCLAESLSLYTSPGLIVEATLTVTTTTPAGTSIHWYLSADGGTNWESATPGSLHTFTYPGNDLRWRANISNTNDARTASISSVSIDYSDIPLANPLLPAIIAVIAVIIIILVILFLYFFWYKKQQK
jgi:hypothetical protein